MFSTHHNMFTSNNLKIYNKTCSLFNLKIDIDSKQHIESSEMANHAKAWPPPHVLPLADNISQKVSQQTSSICRVKGSREEG